MVEVAGSAEGTGRPDPRAARTPEEFVDCLRRLKRWSGFGFRRLEKRAAAAGDLLPRSTATAVLTRSALPREDFVAAFARACGCDADEVPLWLAARRRIAAGALPPQAPAEDPPVQAAVIGAARCTLPADQPVFVGRDKELDQIAAAVADAAQGGKVIAIHAIDGMAGVGKTTVAVRAAHRLTERFSDRQLFVDLHGHTPGRRPTDPGDALADLLAADGADTRGLPDGLDARSAIWRARMSGKKLLLLLDDAASTEQILPLLPGSRDCLVLVTSRRSLGDLGAAVPVPLDVLAPEEAAAMFVGLAPRAASDPDAVTDLVRACGYLPLAISIVACLYQRHRAWTINDLLAEIREPSGGLLTLTAEDRTVAAVFDLSYQNLGAQRQRFFRLLGLHPGSNVDPYAAAALAGTTYEEATTHLRALHRDRLLEETGYRRYRLHDLIRAYARALTAASDSGSARDEAVIRLMDYYQHTAARADAHLGRYTRPLAARMPTPAAAPKLATWEQASAWLRDEAANLLACIRHAISSGQHAHTVGLITAIAAFLRTEGPFSQALRLHEAAAAAAQLLGDRRAHATAMHDQAVAQWLSGDYPAATSLLLQALEVYDELGDRHGQATTRYQLGVVRRLEGDYPASEAQLGQALSQYRTLGDALGQANTLHDLGALRWQAGEYPVAADLLGQALERYRALGNRLGEATALYQLGVVRLQAGDHPTAGGLLEQALHQYRTLGNQFGEANSLNDLAVVRRLSGDHVTAAGLHRQAIDLFQAVGDQHSEAIASTQLAVVGYLGGDYSGAENLLRQALTILRRIGAQDDEAEALNHLATVQRLTGRPGQAQALHHEALEIARRIHHPIEEAHALEGIGRAAVDLGHTEDAIENLRQSLEIYRRLGVPEADRLATDLSTLTAVVQP